MRRPLPADKPYSLQRVPKAYRKQNDASWFYGNVHFKPQDTQHNIDGEDVWSSYIDYWLVQAWAALPGKTVDSKCLTLIVKHSDVLHRPEQVVMELARLGLKRKDGPWANVIRIQQQSVSENAKSRLYHMNIIRQREHDTTG